MFWTAVDFEFNIHFANLFAQRLHDALNIGFTFCALHADFGNQILVSVRIQIAQAEIFQLLLNLINTKSMRKRRIDIQSFLRNALLTLWRLRFERTHVMRTVGKLNQNHTDIFAHRKNHLTNRFGLLFDSGREIKAFQLGDAIDKKRYFLAKLTVDQIKRNLVAVFYRIMKKTGSNGRCIEHQLCKDAGNSQRMDKIWLTRLAHLTFMCFFSKMVGLFNESNIRVGVIFDH